MKKYIIIIIAVAFSSCSKWLDVQPQTQVSLEQLFTTEDGFKEALNGLYSRGASGDLYGNELTFGLPDVLAQNYFIETSNNDQRYLQASKYNYLDADFVRRRDQAWGGLYNVIGNCNLILENIDAKKNLFTGDNYSLIKGEAIGLRAYFHFDVLRLFAPSFVTGAGQKAIPYVTTYTNKVTSLSTVTESLDKMIADLEQAKTLLRGIDPILSASYMVGYPNTDTSRYTEQLSPELFLQNRRHRLNYYAVCGELARVYLYKGDKANALLNAKEVIDSKKFPWTAESEFINSDVKLKDRIMYNELVFAWAIPDMVDDLVYRFTSDNKSLMLKEEMLKAIYEVDNSQGNTGGYDMRYKQWFLAAGVGNDYYALQKYLRNPDAKEDDVKADRYPLMAPALRLSEMFYIASECSYDASPETAFAYMDSVLIHRSIPDEFTASSKDEFENKLVKEVRKETYGEGQVFYIYKRLNKAIVGPYGSPIGPDNSIFVLPLPDDEIEFGQR